MYFNTLFISFLISFSVQLLNSKICNSGVKRLVPLAMDFAVSGLSPVNIQNFIPDSRINFMVSGTLS